jgi:hypothetical protein
MKWLAFSILRLWLGGIWYDRREITFFARSNSSAPVLLQRRSALRIREGVMIR